MTRTAVAIVAFAIVVASCTEGEAVTTGTSVDPTTTIVATTIVATTEMVADTTGADSEPPVSWIEYDACVRAHWHEEGIDLPFGLFDHPDEKVGMPLGLDPPPRLALEEIVAKCEPWRPVPYERPEYVGREIVPESWYEPLP